MEALRKALTRAAAPVSIIGAVGGFIGDIVAPLGNFAPLLAVVSLLGAVPLLLGFNRLRRLQGAEAWDSPVAGGLIVAASSTVVFGIWSLVFAAGPQNGYLAENVAPIATLQAQLLDLQEDVTEIKQTTGAAATQAALAATAQAQGFADIQAAFAGLQAGQGSLVDQPQTPQEWYSNARLYQLRGDTANALQAYQGYFTFNLEYVDPFEEYTALLKATEGIARTRQIIADMLNALPDSLTLEITLVRLLDAPDERLARLEALTTRARQYGPAFFELGQEYDRALAGTVTNDLLQKQQAAYATLFDLEQQQQFSRYYIDKSLAEDHLEDARRTRAAYANAGAIFGAVDVQIYRYNTGVQFAVVAAALSTAKDLRFGIDDPEPKTSTGRVGVGAQTAVNPGFGPLPLPVGDHILYLQYIDANDVPSEVFSQPFRVDPIAITFLQQPPDFSTNTIPGLFSVGLLGATGAELYTFRYSIDDDSLVEEYRGVSVTAITVTGLTPGEHMLYIQGTAEDGAQTEVVQFPFTVR